jgi:hypothetical protein
MESEKNDTDPTLLVSPNRLDIFCRLEFVRDQISGTGRKWGAELYKEFINNSAINSIGVEEWGEDGKKYSYSDYETSFNELIQSIMTSGFDAINHPIPVSGNIPVNGAHRLAIALNLGLKIGVENSSEQPPQYNYRFLQRIGMSNPSVDFVALDYIRTVISSRYLVFFGLEKKLVLGILNKVFPDTNSIIMVKNLALSELGKRRLIDLCYAHNEWWDNELLEKMVGERFEINAHEATVVFFDLKSLSSSEMEIKEKVRSEMPRGSFLRKVHGSDFTWDTNDLAEIVLSQAGRTFLNYSPIGSEFEVIARLSEVGFARRLFDPISRELIIAGSVVHQLFGVGNARDIDYFCSKNFEIRGLKFKGADSHDEFYRQTGINGEEILSNPLLHFCFRGYLFTNPNYVSFIKLAHNEGYSLSLDTRKNVGPEHRSLMRQLKRKAYVQRMKFQLEETKVRLYRVMPSKIRALYKKIKFKSYSKNRDFF